MQRKIAIVGVDGSGKTELARRLKLGKQYQFNPNQALTEGIVFYGAELKYPDTEIHLKISEISQKTINHSLLLTGSINVQDAVILTLDPTKDLNEQIDYLRKAQKTAMRLSGNKTPNFILVVTKQDTEYPLHTKEEVEQRLAKELEDFTSESDLSNNCLQLSSRSSIVYFSAKTASDDETQELIQILTGNRKVLSKRETQVAKEDAETQRRATMEQVAPTLDQKQVEEYAERIRRSLIVHTLDPELTRLREKYKNGGDGGRIKILEDVEKKINDVVNDLKQPKIVLRKINPLNFKEISDALKKPIIEKLDMLDDTRDWHGWGRNLALRALRAISWGLSFIPGLGIPIALRHKYHPSHRFFSPVYGNTYATGEDALKKIDQIEPFKPREAKH